MLFENLYKNMESIERIPPFVETKTIKTKMYKRMVKEIELCGLIPGNSIQTSRLLSEATLSGYKFQNHKQYIFWTNEYIKKRMHMDSHMNITTQIVKEN